MLNPFPPLYRLLIGCFAYHILVSDWQESAQGGLHSQQTSGGFRLGEPFHPGWLHRLLPARQTVCQKKNKQLFVTNNLATIVAPLKLVRVLWNRNDKVPMLRFRFRPCKSFGSGFGSRQYLTPLKKKIVRVQKLAFSMLKATIFPKKRL
jgi:hypothetical protein